MLGGGGFDISDTECIDMRVPEIPLHLIEYKITKPLSTPIIFQI